MTYEEERKRQIMEEIRKRERAERAWLEPKVLDLRNRQEDLINRNRELQGLPRNYRRPLGWNVRDLSVKELYSERHELAQENWELALQNYRLKKEQEGEKE